MKAIVQDTPWGCAVACVASRLGISYKKALCLFRPELEATKGYYCRDVCRALAKRGKKYCYCRCKPRMQKELNKLGTIVFIAKSKKYPEGHYLLKTRNGWMNPWINLPKITPARAGFQKKLPGNAAWLIYEV